MRSLLPRLRRLLAGPLFFALTNVGAAAFGFALLPLLTRALDSGAFARWVLCESAWLLAGQFLLFGLGHGAVYQISSAQRPWRAVYRAHIPALGALVAAGGVVGAGVALGLGLPGIAIAVALNIAAEGVSTYQAYVARAASLRGLYAVLSVGRPALVVLSVAAVALAGPGAQADVLLAWLLAARAACSVGVVLACHVVCMRGGPERAAGPARGALIVDAVRFGFPLAASGAALFAQDALMRSALASFVSAEAVERYYLHAKCISILGSFIVGPVGLWWGPQRFRLAARGDAAVEAAAARALRGSLVLYAVLLGAMTAALPVLLQLFGPRVAPDPWLLVLLAVPPACQLVATLTNAGLMQPGATQSLAHAQLLGLVLLAIGVVPAALHGGEAGACAVSAVAALAVAVWTTRGSLQRLPLNYQVWRSGSVALAAMLATLGAVHWVR